MKNILQKIQQFFYRLEFLLIFIFVFSVYIYISGYFEGYFRIKILMSMSDWILYATFLALIWYAEETKKIREIEQTPVVDLYYRPQTSKHEKYFRLRNSGKGTAYNIKIEKIKNNGKEFEFYFSDPNLILINNCEQTLFIQSKDGHNGNASYRIRDQALEAFLSYISERAIKHKLGIKIFVSYENYLKKEFKRTFYIYCRNHLNYDEIYKKEFEVEFLK